MTDKPDEIDEIKNILFDLHDLLDSYSDLEYRANYMQELLPRLKQAILALKKKWLINELKDVRSCFDDLQNDEEAIYIKYNIEDRINQLNGDKR